MTGARRDPTGWGGTGGHETGWLGPSRGPSARPRAMVGGLRGARCNELSGFSPKSSEKPDNSLHVQQSSPARQAMFLRR